MNKNTPIIVIIIATILFLLLTSPFNLGFSPDSLRYIEVARNVTEGNGIVNFKGELVTHWPPGFPLILGLISRLFHLDPLYISPFFNAVLLITYGVTFVYILRELISSKVTILVLMFVLFTSTSTTVFSMFWSEGLFLSLMLLGLLYFLLYIKLKSNRYLYLSGLLFGLLFITRFAGIGLIGGIVLYVLISERSIRGRIKTISTFMAPTIVVFALWSWYSFSIGASPTNRTIEVHWVTLKTLFKGVITVAKWFISSDHIFLSTSLLLLLFVLIFRLIKSKTVSIIYILNNNKSAILFLVSIIGSYIGFLLLSISFIDKYTPLDNRILSPIFPILLLLLGIFLEAFSNDLAISTTFRSILILLVFITPLTTYDFWKSHYQKGSGYTNVEYRSSNILNAFINSDLKKTYTNVPEYVRLYRRVELHSIPNKMLERTQIINKDFPIEIEDMKTSILYQGAQIIYFNNNNWKWYHMQKEELLKEFKDFKIEQFQDGFLIRK